MLIEIRGHMSQIRVRQVAFEPASLDKNCVFVLDAGLTIIQWNGRKANRIEKAKGLEIASTIKFKER